MSIFPSPRQQSMSKQCQFLHHLDNNQCLNNVNFWTCSSCFI
jgi:hypothetical protein